MTRWFTFHKGSAVGSRNGEPVVLKSDLHVEVTIDDGQVADLARQAARNKSHRARSGPVLAVARKR